MQGREKIAGRACGSCSLCCTVLRVDALAKLGGRPCMHLREGGGCAVHAVRPGICRAYRCAWLRGAFRDEDRPDALGAVLDIVSRGDATRLVIRQAEPDAWDRSPRLRALAAEIGRSMPVEIRDVGDVLDPDRPFRILQPDGSEWRVHGDAITVLVGGRIEEERRAPLLERVVRAVTLRIHARRLARWPSHEDRARELGRSRGAGAARRRAR